MGGLENAARNGSGKGGGKVFHAQDEANAPWNEKTLWQLQARRFERETQRLSDLSVRTMMDMDRIALAARIEAGWQDIPKKPLRAQQAAAAREAVLRTIEMQADCLCAQEHALCERMLITGGCTRINDAQEMDAARALSLRLLAHVGLDGGQPSVALEPEFAPALEAAFSRPEHARIRMRMFSFAATVSAALYLSGVLDDAVPQRLFCAQVLGEREPDEEALALARHYLWAGFDCVDYPGGVLLVHPGVTEIAGMMPGGEQLAQFTAQELLGGMNGILPQEEQLDEVLCRAIEDALRPGFDVQECVRGLRILCKQGAPMSALYEVLDGLLMVRRTARMDAALRAMHAGVVRWHGAVQPAVVLQ